MEILKEKFGRPINAYWVNRLDRLDYPEFNAIVTSVCEKHNSKRDDKTIRTLLTMCYKSWKTESVCHVVMDSNYAAVLNKGVKKRKLKYSPYSFRRVIKTMLAEGYIEFVKGRRFCHHPEYGFISYIYPTQKLISMFKEGWDAFYYAATPDVLEIKVSNSKHEVVTEKQIGKNPKIKKRKEELEEYNSFLSKSLFEYKGTRNLYYYDKKKHLTIKKTIKAKRRLIPFLSSVYSGDFDHGGRLYARKVGVSAIYQSLSKKDRATITINNRKTKELDFSCLHLNMLYAMKDIQLEGDAYSFYSDRKLAKKAILACLNSKKKETAVKALMYERKGNTYIMKKSLALQIIDSALKFHSSIASFFFSGDKLGSKLQNMDSNIMMEILKTMQSKGITALPVHDSVIVREDHIQEAARIMKKTYKRIMGYKIEVK